RITCTFSLGPASTLVGNVTERELSVGVGVVLRTTGCPPICTAGVCPGKLKNAPVIVSRLPAIAPLAVTWAWANAPTGGFSEFSRGGWNCTTLTLVLRTMLPFTGGGGVGVISTSDTS